MRPCRALFLSDVHLGRAGARPGDLAAFLLSVDPRVIYVVGDLFDRLRPGDRPELSEADRVVLDVLRACARRGVRIVYVPGNHDSRLRQRLGRRAWLPDAEVVLEAIHVTADGRRFLVVHGDGHEPAGVRGNPLLRPVLKLHNGLEWVSRMVSRVPGMKGRSLARMGKDLVLYRVGPGRAFRDALAREARGRGFDGAIAGHIHHPGFEAVDGVLVANCGDWLSSCTALIELDNGRLELVTWRG